MRSLCVTRVLSRRQHAAGRLVAVPTRLFSSVSQNEVDKFTNISNVWWDPRKNPLIHMNPVRVQYIVDQMKKSTNRATTNSSVPPLQGLKAVDIGCGGGLLSESLARLGASVTAVDPSEALVEQARARATLDPEIATAIDYRGNWTVEQLVEDDPSLKGSFDLVCMLEVVEHVSSLESMLHAASVLMKNEGGRLFVSTMNRTWKSHALTIVGAEYIMGYLPIGTHDWNLYRSPQEMEEQMKSVGLVPVNVQGMILSRPPLFGQWDWRLDPKDVDVNWIGTYKSTTQAN